MAETGMIPYQKNKCMKKGFLATAAFAGLLLLTSATTNYFEISKYLDIFVGVYKNLNSYYVDDVNPKELVTVGIDAMLEELDPYSDFIPAEELQDFEFQSTGEYGGIGSTILKVNDYIEVVSPYQGSPADKAGLQAGDQFLEIDGISAKGKSAQEVVKQLKGEPGTTVKVKMGRGEKTFDRELTREIIKVHNVPYAGLQKDGIGYIKLSSFTQGAGKEVADAIEQFKQQGHLNGIVLDLKGNGGGLLAEAIAVANVFVPQGTEVVTIQTRDGAQNKTYKAPIAATDLTTPLVVLIDGGTASASEIVSGTIQDLDRGVVIGRNSFGKGLVQSTRDLSYDTKLKLTTAKYLIPSGRCVQRINYADKDEYGNALEIPDSLRTAFSTQNGRTVYDGSGIMPDVKVEAERISQIAFTLFSNNLIYDYSLAYKASNPTIAGPKEFTLTDAEYEEFKQFLVGKDYSYQTESERELEQMKEAAEDEIHDASFYSALEALETNLSESKADDLDKYKDEIKYLLEREIASRYYYIEGRVANGLDDDDEYKKAKELIANQTEYNAILTP